MDYHSTNGQKMAVIEAGPDGAGTMLMLHGGPGYCWLKPEVDDLSASLAARGAALKILAQQGRGCGYGDYASPSTDLTDDSLLKRAEDLKAFDAPDILLGHSTGAMIALTAVMEGFIRPKKLLLLSPYTAALGEHEYWVTEKAKKYPAAFGRFHDSTLANWKKYKGDPPKDFTEKLYIHWGALFFSLKDREEQLTAVLRQLDFHVIDCEPPAGQENGEPYTQYKGMAENPAALKESTKETLVRGGTINAHWWRTNFQDGYPFIEKLQKASFACPVHILSGQDDEITPPHTVRKLAALLGVEAVVAPDSRHLPEKAMPGRLKEHLAALVSGICGGARPAPELRPNIRP